MRRVVVVGAGVVGLSCAVRLAEAGHDVHVLARDLPLETTSAVAAALWHPSGTMADEPARGWAHASYTEFVALARDEPAAGVDLVEGSELLRSPAPEPWWLSAVPGRTRLGPHERPPGYEDGWRLRLPVVDMSVYLPWLVGRLEALGGTLTRHWVDALPDAPLVVNCSGLAARRLAADPTVHPVAGQVVLLERGAVDHWLFDEGDPRAPVYVVPRRHAVVVGGTATADVWLRDPDPAVTARLLERAVALEPRLARARVLGARVGLRPMRPSVRLEAEVGARGGTVVHCYGHGGAGVTLSWGCADAVAALVDRALSRSSA
jgi:D-amino-acid oxidase